ncbi:MAG: type I methionyl aminopeptidase [Clostridia bacterium]|jgi:methionyl aminopeptidase|nr:type I methionyl aminopeptidase [Clostridia bacterium]MDO4836182.1 type I methionyl aminopeptidase [Clostridia bacterium]
MITIKSAQDIERMKAAGKVVEDTLKLLERSVRVGITTAELDRIADEFIRSQGAYPTFLHYNGYPKSVCISVNEEVVHGIPGKRKLRDGDIVSCDVGATLNGFVGDAARTFLIGNVPEETQELVRVTRECFFEGLKFCRVGYRISDISKAIQKHAESHGYGVVRELVGHGVGRVLHEDPEVPNFYSPRARQRLEAGMTIAIEPMINLGTAKVWQLDDGWTVTTQDGKPSAHYENSVAITDGDPILLTCSEAFE